MRILHTADLHIGKRLHEMNLAEDQKFVLDEIVSIAKSKKCDAVCIAGDIYDKTTPSAEAMGIFDAFVSALVLQGISIYAIGGNHDSGERVNYFSGLLQQQNVVLEGRYDGTLCKKTITDEFGEMDIYLLPYIKPVLIRTYFPDEKIETYEQAMSFVLREAKEEMQKDPNRRRILLSHQFVMGCGSCESEEIAIGGLDQISGQVYEGFDYVALGHLHGPQKAYGDMVRYSGTPLKYSLSECSHKKSVTIVTLEEKGNISLELVPLNFLRDVRSIRGNYEELIGMPVCQDYVELVVTDEEVVPNARVSLMSVFPNMIRFRVDNTKVQTATTWEQDDIDLDEKSKLELMEEFYKMQNQGVAMSDGIREILLEVCESLGGIE